MSQTDIQLVQFTGGLMQWHLSHNRREMPWKGEPDPYRIWLSEIILQQTRVEQGMGYYLRFTSAFPDVYALASAPDKEVFKLWEGLGYYSRCRNLLHTARTIVADYGGVFPADYYKLLGLKGIGPYTAAAIASFGFGLPYAVVDGNVIRVLSRFFNIETPFDSSAGKNIFREMADRVLDRSQPGIFNQAIMDFGATICKPVSPRCHDCPLKENCQAYAFDKVAALPVKERKAPRKTRFFVYLVLSYKNKTWIRERTGKDIWRHLHEFFLTEMADWESLVNFESEKFCRENGWKAQEIAEIPGVYEQALTHQQIKTRFIGVKLASIPVLPDGGKWVFPGEIKEHAFPRTFTRLLGEMEL